MDCDREPDLLKELLCPASHQDNNSKAFLLDSLALPQKLESTGSNASLGCLNLVVEQSDRLDRHRDEETSSQSAGDINEELPGGLESSFTSKQMEDFSKHLESLPGQLVAAEVQADPCPESLERDPYPAASLEPDHKTDKLGHSVEALLNPDLKFRCSVCHQPMDKNRLHYGGNSCYSCRAFFRRRVKTSGNNKLCSNGGSCNIEEWERKKCIPCRYMACLMAGMRPENVLTDQGKQQRFRQKIAKEGSISMKKCSGLSTDEKKKLVREKSKQKYLEKYYKKLDLSESEQKQPVFAKIEVNIGNAGEITVRNPFNINQTVQDTIDKARLLTKDLEEPPSRHACGLETIWEENNQVKLKLPELDRRTPFADQFLGSSANSSSECPVRYVHEADQIRNPFDDAHDSFYTNWLRTADGKRALQQLRLGTEYTRSYHQQARSIPVASSILPDIVSRSMPQKRQLASLAQGNQHCFDGRRHPHGMPSMANAPGWYPPNGLRDARIRAGPRNIAADLADWHSPYSYPGHPTEQLAMAVRHPSNADMLSKMSVIKFSGRSSH